MAVSNPRIADYNFLAEMYRDGSFPNFLVDKGKAILIKLCERIETENPANLESLYRLTHDSTKQFNALQEEFSANDSEIETSARDCIGLDFDFIAKAYGFDEASNAELISPRDW